VGFYNKNNKLAAKTPRTPRNPNEEPNQASNHPLNRQNIQGILDCIPAAVAIRFSWERGGSIIVLVFPGGLGVLAACYGFSARV
jgi:hypothetical protein